RYPTLCGRYPSIAGSCHLARSEGQYCRTHPVSSTVLSRSRYIDRGYPPVESVGLRNRRILGRFAWIWLDRPCPASSYGYASPPGLARYACYSFRLPSPVPSLHPAGGLAGLSYLRWRNYLNTTRRKWNPWNLG